MSLFENAVAHRGGVGLGPENTMRAFALSHALGVRLLETDVRVTADGVALAFHDARLGRATGIGGLVARRTWNDVRCLRVDGEPLVRLDELLNAFPDTGFLVDVKNATGVPAVIETVRRTRSADRVCVAGGRDGWLADISDRSGARRAMGWAGLSALLWAARLGVRPPPAALRGCLGAHVPTELAGFAWMACPRVADRLVTMTHDAGLRLLTWTVNDPEQMRRYLDAGTDAVITDRPDLLREVLLERGTWRAPASERVGSEPVGSERDGRRALDPQAYLVAEGGRR